MRIDGRTISHEVLEANRFAAIKLRESGVELKVIANSFSVTIQAVYGWFKKYDKTGPEGLTSTKPTGRSKILTDDQIKKLIQLLRQPASKLGYSTDLWSGTRVRHLIKHQFGIEYHAKHISRLLKSLGLWLVFPERRALEQDSKQVRTWKAKQLPEIINTAKQEKALLFYADESLISLTPYVGKTWSFPETKPIVCVSGIRGQHTGITAAVNQQGRMCFELTREHERFTAMVFIRFLKKMHKEYPNKKLSLIVDGAPTHKAKIVRNFVIDNQKWLRLEILPPYSPELNPTEKTWRFIKTKKLNASMVKNKSELRKAVFKAMRKTKKDKNKVISFFDG